MARRETQGRVGLLAALMLACVASGAAAAPPAAKAKATSPGARAVTPATPELPAEVVAALQAGRFADASAALERLGREAKGDDGAYLALIRGIAERLGGRLDAARTVLAGALEAAPRGPWAGKLRFELAGVELLAGRFDRAEALAREEAQALLADERKDRLAEVFHAYARRLIDPDDRVTPPDPEAAYALLDQARSLAKGSALRARLLASMGRASQKANNHPRAVENFRAYLATAPKGEERDEVRLRLGESLLAAGQADEARRTWLDLARDLEGKPGDVRARALYLVATTYGVPSPPDDTRLNLGVAALKRFLAAAPDHEWAPKAAYEIGAAYLARGKSQQALEALTALLKGEGVRAEGEAARRDLAERSRTATFQIGQILQGQRRFAEAIEAWKGYLAKYPDGPQSAEAQRAILDTQLLVAQDKLRLEQYADARAAWQAFAAQNPLDPRVPQVLFEIGQVFAIEKDYPAAIAAWETLAGKFPGSEPAAHAQFAIAALLETETGDPAGAVERFKRVQVEPWASQARQRVAAMESRELTVVTPRAFRSGETPHLRITTRNLETLTFTAYRLNPESYFRKKHGLQAVESLDIGLVATDAEWTVPVPGYAKYKPVERPYEMPKLEVPGVYVVKVTDEVHLQATTLVLGSDLDAIVKASRDQVLVFAQDMKTGKGRPDARVLVSDGQSVILDARTGADGVLLARWETPRGMGPGLSYLVFDGKDVAGLGLGLPDQVAQGLSPRAYIDTDRPAYRPGQSVALRGIVREVEDGQYASPKGATYRLDVSDSRGRLILSKPVTLSDFGTFHDVVDLDPSAPVGGYKVRVHRPGKSEFFGGFEVRAYKLEALDLEFDLPRTVYFRGEPVKGSLKARYQYGAPAAGRPIVVSLPDGRNLSGKTGADGTFAFEFATEAFAEEQLLPLTAQLPEDNVAASRAVRLAVRAFNIELETARDVYLDGESFPIRITTVDAQGEPTGEKVTVSVLKRINRGGEVVEREASKVEATTDKESGKANVRLTVDDREGGPYVVRVAGTDRFGNPVVADRALTISGRGDETRLRILADRQGFKVGETAKVNLHARGNPGPALLAWEADRVLTYRLVELKEGDNPVEWAVDGPQFPNFTLTAARMAGDRFDQARLDVKVERDLRVTIRPVKPTVGPGEEVEVEVTAVDQLGKPVSAELSLAAVDLSLLRLYGDRTPPIGPFFYSQSRTGAFATEATNTFRYQPSTEPVSEALVDEQQRAATLAIDAEAKDAARDRAAEMFAYRGAAPNAPMPAPADAAPIPGQGQMMGGMGGMGGRMGGMGGAGLVAGEELTPELVQESEEADKAEATLAKRLPADPRRAQGRMYFGLGASTVGGRVAQPREQFVETAYWNPSVVTDREGKARVTFPAPTALSRYELKARGTTGSDTLVGQATATLTVKKDVFVELLTPATLTQGDRPRFRARLHHTGAVGNAELKLTTYAGGREAVDPRKVEVKADGVDEVLFEPFEVPEGDVVRLTLSAALGKATDEVVVEVPIRPWGVQALASAAGTGKDDATVFVGLPPGRSYDNPEMLIVLAPSVRRLLVELALGREFHVLRADLARCIFPPPPNTTADRAADLLAAASALGSLKQARAGEAPEAGRLAERIRGLVAELLTLQNDDGGWPWVAGPTGEARPSDRLVTARAVWALAAAESHGLVPDPAALEKATGYLAGQFAQVDADPEARAAILHALSTRGKASFEAANSLNRSRQNLPDAALADLALTLANLDRASLAAEVLGVLGPRAKAAVVSPGSPPQTYWEGRGQHVHAGPIETTALAALAYARVRPDAPERAASAEWLLAQRRGTGWDPHVAKGAALAALAASAGPADVADDNYRLVVAVNGKEVARLEVKGQAEGKAIAVPNDALKLGDRNRVSFDIEGRGTFGYAVTLAGFAREFGPDQDRRDKPAVINRRVYWPAQPEYDGRPLANGFGSVINPQYFENTVSQVGLGKRATVAVQFYRQTPDGQQPWERPYLVLEEYLPAGTTLVEGSVRTDAHAFEVGDGVLTFYFAPDQYPGEVRYDVVGYLPGAYRALPAKVRDAYDPGRYHLGEPGGLKVLEPGEASTDPYRSTPDELYDLGKRTFQAGDLAAAGKALEALRDAYTLQSEVAKDVARMLLTVHIKQDQPRKIVQDFEILKEKAPDQVIPFDEILVVGRAYRDIGEHERAFLVWKAIVEASYLEDARVGQELRRRGEALGGLAALIDLWREYPNTASIESDFFALSQVYPVLAGKALDDPATRRELAEAGVARADLLLQSVRLVQAFLAQSPRNPLADEASLALVGAFLDLEDPESVVRLAERFAGLYPKSKYLDGFQFSEALGRFQLGQYDRAIATAETIASATYTDENGVEQPSPNKWQALYILGQIYDARRQPAKALEFYTQVADRFTDAAGAVKAITRKALALPEVTVIRPAGIKAGDVGEKPAPPRPGRVELTARNLAEADVKVYPVDLMRLYLTRRNLDAIAGIDLAGITPKLETSIPLAGAADHAESTRPLDLPLDQEGAYLVMARGENLYASGIALVTPLELEVLEECEAGRVRVAVRDASTKDPVPKVQVRVIGTDNPGFLTGQTDLRGVYVAEGVRGQVTAVARKGASQYAFYRGTAYVGQPPAPKPAEAQPGQSQADAPNAAPEPSQSLDQNLRDLNLQNRSRQLDRLEGRYGGQPGKGVQVKEAN